MENAIISELKSRKDNLGLSVAEVAELASVPLGTVSKIMTGETRSPKSTTLEMIDKALQKEEERRRIEAYLTAMREYGILHPKVIDNPNEFEGIYRKMHNLEEKPIAQANSKSGRLLWSDRHSSRKKRISADSFLHMGYDNRWTELFEGRVIVNEAPGLAHQLLVKDINRQIEKYIEGNKGKCKVFDVGINVKLNEEDDSILIPDILVICDGDKLKPFGILGAPDWVVEVVSPSTRQYDYKRKTFKYLSGGVRELWLVDIEKRIVVTYVDGDFVLSHMYRFEESIPVSIYGGELLINISE